MKTKFIILTGLASIIFTSCSSGSQIEEDPQEELTAEVVSKPQESEVGGMTITGRVEVGPNAHVSIHAPINSYIADIHVKTGDQISKGQILAYVEHPDILKLQEDYLSAKGEFEVEKENFQRKQELFKSNAVSRKEFLEAEKSFITSKARFERLAAEIEFTGVSTKDVEQVIIKRIPIRSPITGVVTEVAGNKGKFVSASDELITIIDTKDKWIVFQIFPDQLGMVENGDTLVYQKNGLEGGTVVQSISGAMNDATRGMQVVTIPLDQNSLKVGEIITGRVTTR